MLVSRLLLRSSFGIDGLQRVGAAEGLLEGEAFGPFSTPSAVGSAERAGRYRCGDWLHQGTVVKLGASQNGGAQCLTMHLVPSSARSYQVLRRLCCFINLAVPVARDGRRLPRHARYRRTQHTCAHPLDTSRGPQVANRGARAPKTAIFRQIGRSGALGQPGSSPGGAAARRAAIPSRARMYATVPWAGRRSSTRPRAGGPARASFRRRAETADAAPSGPRARAGRRRARVPRRGRGGAPRTARGLRRRPERRPGAGGRRPRTRLRGPAAGDRAGPGSGPARAGSAPATCTTSVGAAEPITDAALASRRGALADPRKRHEVVPPRNF